MRQGSTSSISGESDAAQVQSHEGMSSGQDETLSCRWRGLRWRVMLGVLPSCPTTIGELRRGAANGRRRYAGLRRRLLVDPHIMEDVQKPSHLSMDNPLSQDPESVWGRYFRNAELERTIDKDLARLYPEHGSFFQSPLCQAMLRRILLVWSLIHPHYSYRQGMHELLAPLLYVLHMDILHFSELKQRYEDLFDDRFDGPPIPKAHEHEKKGIESATSFSTHKALLITERCKSSVHDEWVERIAPQDWSLFEPDEFGFDLGTLVLGSDIYGAEGELGALLSGRFVEHDAYCMFDALLSGQGGAVAVAEYFTIVNGVGSATGLPPVLEASATLYRVLAASDASLFNHLVAMGVEPQFFALRWLRVLFGREFALENLLCLWDAIFSAPNTALPSEESEDGIDNCKFSLRSAFISALAVSMLLYLRPILLAAPDATSCLQKLLNFPQSIDVKCLIDNAKVLQPLAGEAASIVPTHVAKMANSFEQSRSGKLLVSGNVSPPFQRHAKLQYQNPCSPELLRSPLPESYWEEKWKNSVLQKIIPEGVVSPQNIQPVTMMGEPIDKILAPNALSHGMVRSPIESSVEVTIKEKQNLLGKETVHTVVGDNVNQSVRRKLISGPIGGKRKPLSTCSSLDLPESPIGSDSSESNYKQDIEGETTINVTEVHANSPQLDKRISIEAGGTLQRDVGKDDTVAFEESVQVFPLFHDGISQADSDDQSSSSSVVSEDGGSLRKSAALLKSKALPVGLRAGRFSWMWNFYRREPRGKTSIQPSNCNVLINGTVSLANGTGHPNVTTNSSANDSIEAKQEANLTTEELAGCMTVAAVTNSITDGEQEEGKDGLNQVTRLERVVTSKGLSEVISDGSDISEILKQNDASTALQTLGQSMLDNIQVLEITLLRTAPAFSEGQLGTSVVSRESSEQMSKTFLVGNGHVAAFAALADLRKISNLLLQM